MSLEEEALVGEEVGNQERIRELVLGGFTDLKDFEDNELIIVDVARALRKSKLATRDVRVYADIPRQYFVEKVRGIGEKRIHSLQKILLSVGLDFYDINNPAHEINSNIITRIATSASINYSSISVDEAIMIFNNWNVKTIVDLARATDKITADILLDPRKYNLTFERTGIVLDYLDQLCLEK